MRTSEAACAQGLKQLLILINEFVELRGIVRANARHDDEGVITRDNASRVELQTANVADDIKDAKLVISARSCARCCRVMARRRAVVGVRIRRLVIRSAS